ncbi:hypothetical protein [Haloarchaeobius sp. HME9146]|uniref:DUF7504 family protein n=1 Tax=Haloarchaeobius sp. HME9146 TaxID=2978732 RepID=UPI0021C00479|nr:hypothetical protein [Haloarchaeobius sp. HME9146]MCT9097209.1 hypothetical protein [Haloarchaeobius sp. HME9146]
MDADRIVFERQLSGAKFRDGAGDEDFSAILADYKQHGCAMLVSGDVGMDTVARAFRLLGGSADADRKRVVLTPSTDQNVASFLPEGVSPSDPDVRVYAGDEFQSLSGVRNAVFESVVRFDTRESTLGSGQLRLLAPTAGALLADVDPQRRERFFRSLGTVVRGCRGMGYFHVGADDVPHGVVDLFDGWIELREGATGPQQRWHVPAGERTTTWMSL